MPQKRGSKFPERDAEILRLWNEGKSAGVIEMEMFTDGVSRHVVIGVVHRARLGGAEGVRRGGNGKNHQRPRRKRNDLPTRTKEDDRDIERQERGFREMPKPTMPKIKKGKPAPILIAKLPEVATENRWVGILETGDKTCRYTQDGKLFCNDNGFPYCPEHKKKLGSHTPAKISAGRYPY